MSSRVEYAIRWDTALLGFPDISTPHESRAMVEMALEGSAFNGEIVRRVVTETEWEVDA